MHSPHGGRGGRSGRVCQRGWQPSTAWLGIISPNRDGRGCPVPRHTPLPRLQAQRGVIYLFVAYALATFLSPVLPIRASWGSPGLGSLCFRCLSPLMPPPSPALTGFSILPRTSGSSSHASACPLPLQNLHQALITSLKTNRIGGRRGAPVTQGSLPQVQ